MNVSAESNPMDGRTGLEPPVPPGATPVDQAPHGTFWWKLKLLGAMALIACGMARFLLGVPPAVVVPILWAQILVLTGGGIVLVHYGLLQRRRGRFDRPEELLTRGGLFPVVRHPMYLGDVVMNLGWTLLAGSWLAFWLYGFCLVALQLQARVEDRYLAERFPEAHRHWRLHTGLLWPRALTLRRWPPHR